jgi:hypothetical protein
MEIIRADQELARFVRGQVAECERIGYPKQAAFAKLVAAGTVRATPPEDPVVATVGEFYWQRSEIQRRIMTDRYCRGTEAEKAKRASMSPRRLRIEIDRLLTQLSGFLEARTI